MTSEHPIGRATTAVSEWYVYTNVHLRHYCTLPLPLLGQSPSVPMARVDRYDTGADLSKLTAPNSVVSVDSGVDPVALRPSHRTARPDVVIKVARRTVLRELQLDAVASEVARQLSFLAAPPPLVAGTSAGDAGGRCLRTTL